MAAMWGVRAQKGAFLCGSEKEKNSWEERVCRREEPPGAQPVKGWSSSGQRVMGQSELQLPTIAVDKKGQQGLPDVQEEAPSRGESFPHAGSQTNDF